LKKHHIKARQSWGEFSHDDTEYCLKHLDTHEVFFKGNKSDYTFVVTYGLHCFTKNNQEHSVLTTYHDEFETRQINLERYHLSKFLRGFIENLDSHKLLYETTKEKYFTFEHVNDLTGESEKCKVCLCIFKENRLLRIHVTSGFFDRGNKELNQKGLSIFKIAMDAQKKPKNEGIPKEASRK
jgi:hypothetical protein